MEVTAANGTDTVYDSHLSLSQHHLCIHCCIPGCFQCQRGSCAHRGLKLKSPSAPDGIVQQHCPSTGSLVAAPALRPLWVCRWQGGTLTASDATWGPGPALGTPSVGTGHTKRLLWRQVPQTKSWEQSRQKCQRCLCGAWTGHHPNAAAEQ